MENERSFSSILNMENKWRNAEENIVLNTVIGRVFIFRQNVWLASTKLSGPRAFRPIVITTVAVVTVPFFAAIIIVTRQVVGTSSPGLVRLG
jgi:hypothetical protein